MIRELLAVSVKVIEKVVEKERQIEPSYVHKRVIKFENCL